jgi:hypothetical protein
MGNKSSARPEKKTAKAQPKLAPGRKGEDFKPAATPIISKATEKN